MGNHKEWRKLAKKQRRKRLRHQLAQFRDINKSKEEARLQASPTYQQWVVKKQDQDDFQLREEAQLAKEAEENWLREEAEAQKQWSELQNNLEFGRNERARQQALIKEQWDKEQEKLKKIKEEKERVFEEKHKQQELIQERIESYIKNGGELPAELQIRLESNPSKAICPFFSKTAACRFRDFCSRNHVRPTVSHILLIRNFYTHYSLNNTAENEHGSDSILEFDNTEIYKHFREFFDDVLLEMKKFGDILQFKVCSNSEPHLRGNVYVEYNSCREAILSYRTFQGRYFGGKQITVEFCNIDSWKSAICGLFSRRKCPKGSGCNFLHPFKNPFDMFRMADRDLHRKPPEEDHYSGKHWRWSESPERAPREYDRNSDSRDRRVRDVNKRRSSSKDSVRSSKRKRDHMRSKSKSPRKGSISSRSSTATPKSRSSTPRNNNSEKTRHTTKSRFKKSEKSKC